MESMERAVKGFFDLSRKRLISPRDITKAIRIAILEVSREQAVNAAKAELFSDVRLGEAINYLPDSVGFLAKILRDDGVKNFSETIERIRTLTAKEEDGILQTEVAFIGALWLTELFRTKVIKVAVIQRAIEIALKTATEEAAGDQARKELGNEDLVRSTRDLWYILHTEGPKVFNKLTTHIWRLVNVDYQPSIVEALRDERQDPSFWLSLIRQTKSLSRISEYMANAVSVSDFTMITPLGAALMYNSPNDRDQWTVYMVCGRGQIHFSSQGRRYSYGTGGPARDENVIGRTRMVAERNEDYRILRETFDYLLGAKDTPEVVREALRRSANDLRRMLDTIY